MAAAQVSHADDDNHLAILNAGSHSFSSVLYSDKNDASAIPAKCRRHPVAKDRNNKPADFKDMGGIGGR